MRTRVLPLASILILTSCSNPFVPSSTDYVDRLPEARTRDIEAMQVDAFATSIDVDPEPISPETDDGDEAPPELVLGVEDVRASVLANNLDLRVALVNPAIANETLTQEEAAFEAFLSASGRYVNTDSPTSSTLSDAQANFYSFEPGITLPLRTGGTLSVTAPVGRSETNNSFSTLNPSYTSDLRLSFSHNLMRNAGRFVTTQGIRIASGNRQISEAQTKLEVIRLLAVADRAYWRLFRARAALDVRRTQLELADAQLERARRIVQAGAAPEIEILRAEAGRADQLDAIIVAENDVRAEERQLKEVMNRPGLPMRSGTILTTVTPPDPVPYTLDRDALTSLAIDNRMEMLELELRLAQDIDAIDAARNGTLPLLVIDYSYTMNTLNRSLTS
ncbi:MAG: TolC family protein, partial [Phycisphaerales bacterium]|nr:TolC family protein [Phycisphaerales bacterium]